MVVPSRPALRYFGGKWVLAPWIISHFPEHRVYVEPYGGGASVLLRKPRSYAEIYNDLDEEVVNFFRVLQCKAKAGRLQRLLALTPFSRSEFELSYKPSMIPVERARRLMIRSFMGFGADGHNIASGRTGFRANSNRSGTTPAHDWVNLAGQIDNFCERLSGVVIENRDAMEVMRQQDTPETLHFVDPPYVQDTRGVRKRNYKFDMEDAQHELLCSFLADLKGMVVLCGYRNHIYERLKWQSVDRATFADGAKKRTETIWLNKSVSDRQAQIQFSFSSNA